jgi:hypothetical protein
MVARVVSRCGYEIRVENLWCCHVYHWFSDIKYTAAIDLRDYYSGCLGGVWLLSYLQGSSKLIRSTRSLLKSII